jgi:hypothetical protein
MNLGLLDTRFEHVDSSSKVDMAQNNIKLRVEWQK